MMLKKNTACVMVTGWVRLSLDDSSVTKIILNRQ